MVVMVNHRFPGGVLAAFLAAMAASAGCSGPPAGPPRTVAMSMNSYTFNGTNPTLTFQPGERVHFVVTNDESSRVLHNFRIVGLDVPCGPPMPPGGRREVMVSMPKSGEFAYTCCTHPGMGGKLVVAGR
jgi:plastocyanin